MLGGEGKTKVSLVSRWEAGEPGRKGGKNKKADRGRSLKEGTIISNTPEKLADEGRGTSIDFDFGEGRRDLREAEARMQGAGEAGKQDTTRGALLRCFAVKRKHSVILYQ